MFICVYSFVAVAKITRGEQLSCLFVSEEESGEIHQAIELKRPTNCQIWRLNEKSLISIQDSYFVVKNKFDKERVKKSVCQNFLTKHFKTITIL